MCTHNIGCFFCVCGRGGGVLRNKKIYLMKYSLSSPLNLLANNRGLDQPAVHTIC